MGQEEREAYDSRVQKFLTDMDDRGCMGEALQVGFEVKIKTLNHWTNGVVVSVRNDIV